MFRKLFLPARAIKIKKKTFQSKMFFFFLFLKLHMIECEKQIKKTA